MEVNTNNTNIEELKKMAAIITTDKLKNELTVSQKSVDIQENPQVDIKNKLNLQKTKQINHKLQQPKKVSIQTNDTSDDVAKIIKMNEQGSGNAITPNIMENQHDILLQPNDMIGIMGFHIPKSTLYMTIILIIIASTIWYMSGDGDNKQKKKKKHDDDDE